jgi:hypothetical protein
MAAQDYAGSELLCAGEGQVAVGDVCYPTPPGTDPTSGDDQVLTKKR